jgi:hypothetical protein
MHWCLYFSTPGNLAKQTYIDTSKFKKMQCMFPCRFYNGIFLTSREFHPSTLCFLKWGIQYFVVWDCPLAGFLMGFFWLAEYFHLLVLHCWHEKFNVLEFQRSTTSWKVKAFNTSIVCPMGDKPSLFLYNRFLLPFFLADYTIWSYLLSTFEFIMKYRLCLYHLFQKHKSSF